MRGWRETIGLICLFLTIISLAIAIVINFRPLYLFDIGHLQILDYVDMNRAELIKNFDLLMRYLNNPFQSQLSLPDFPMSESGRFHFYEVKRLFLLDYGVLLVTIVPSILYVRNLVKNSRLWRLLRPFQMGMIIPLILAFLMSVGFDQFFTMFHGVFFNNDAWIFDPRTDPIIMVLPEAFFLHCFVLFFVLIEVTFLIFYLIGRRSLKKV